MIKSIQFIKTIFMFQHEATDQIIQQDDIYFEMKSINQKEDYEFQVTSTHSLQAIRI
jgi:hypothetical protein